ncbi:hypothetical protein DPSP01_007402 [Paraphaeosphaeria sporulosa]
MTLHEILIGIDDIKAELEKMTSCLKRLGERVARIEAAQQSHNGSALSGHAVSDQSFYGLDKKSMESLFLKHIFNEEERQVFAESVARCCARQVQQTVPAELPGEPDMSALHVEEHASAATTAPLASPSEAIVDNTASELQPSLRGGWGDEEAEEILYQKLADSCRASYIRLRLSPLEMQLSSVLQCGLTSL